MGRRGGGEEGGRGRWGQYAKAHQFCDKGGGWEKNGKEAFPKVRPLTREAEADHFGWVEPRGDDFLDRPPSPVLPYKQGH